MLWMELREPLGPEIPSPRDSVIFRHHLMMGIFLLVIVISLFIYVVLLFYCLLLSIVSFTVAAQFNPAQLFYTLATYVWSVATF